MKRLILLSALLVFIVPWAWSQQRGVELLPQSNEIPAWARVDTPQVAIGAQALWDWIDGAGQVFIDHGFVEAWRQVYAGPVPGGVDTIKYAWTFDQMDSAHCYATYHDSRSGSGAPWTDPGHAGWEARIDTTYLWSYQIDFWKGKFFCRIEINEKSDTALALAKRFARTMSDKIRWVGVEEGSPGAKAASPFGFTSVRRNPTRGGCQVEFSMAVPGWARVSVYDAQGRFLRELVQGSFSPGRHRLYWDGKDGDGLPTGPGIFFLRLATEERSATAKLVVVR